MAEHIDAEFDRLKIPKTKTRQRNQDIDRSEKPADLAGEKNKITNDISTLKEKYQKVRGGITFAGPYLKEDKIMIRYNIGEGKNRKTIDISYHEHGGGSKDITELSAHIKEEFKRSNVETVTHKPGPNKGQTLGTLSSRGFTFTKRPIKSDLPDKMPMTMRKIYIKN